jgi:hypothetical protein
MICLRSMFSKFDLDVTLKCRSNQKPVVCYVFLLDVVKFDDPPLDTLSINIGAKQRSVSMSIIS